MWRTLAFDCSSFFYARVMDAFVTKPPRPWRVVADELVHEMDRQKVLQLSEELRRAFARQGLRPATESQTEHAKQGV